MELLSKDFYSVPELAESLGVCEATVRGKIHSGQLAAVQLGEPGKRTVFRIPRASAEAWLHGLLVVQPDEPAPVPASGSENGGSLDDYRL